MLILHAAKYGASGLQAGLMKSPAAWVDAPNYPATCYGLKNNCAYVSLT